MKRYVSTFLRHPLLYLLPLVLVMIGAALLAQQAVRQATPYTAVATVAVNLDPTRARSVAERPPAQQHTELLAELMRTDRFILEALERISIEPQLADIPRGPVLADVIRSRWQQTAVGPNTIRVSFDCADARFCTDFTGAVLNAYRSQVATAQLARRTATVEFYQQQAQNAEVRLSGVLPTDPGYASVRTAYETLNTRLIEARLEEMLATQGVTEGFQVIAPANFQRPPRSALVTAATPLALGAALGLILTLSLVVAMTWMDSRIRAPEDTLPSLGLRTVAVVGQERPFSWQEATVSNGHSRSNDARSAPIRRLGRR